MAVKYKDYYTTLGVDRSDSKDAIRKAYRQLARKYHPDVNQGDRNAEERFKEIQEAYAVLSNPEKRQRYDQLGNGWEAGADFTPPPGWERVRVDFGGSQDPGDVFGDAGGFSDFFQSIFGGFGFEQGGRGTRRPTSTRGGDVEAEIELPLEDIHRGARPTIAVQVGEVCTRCGGRGTRMLSTCPDCGGTGQTVARKKMTVRIPAGMREGSVLKLAGKGTRGAPGGPAGNLFLKIKVKPHPTFEISGVNDLRLEVPVTPWEAALGAKVEVPTLDGSVEMTVPAGTQGGARLRLRGQGLNMRGGGRGDLLVRIKIGVPAHLTSEEESLLKQLARISKFNPRRQ